MLFPSQGDLLPSILNTEEVLHNRQSQVEMQDALALVHKKEQDEPLRIKKKRVWVIDKVQAFKRQDPIFSTRFLEISKKWFCVVLLFECITFNKFLVDKGSKR